VLKDQSWDILKNDDNKRILVNTYFAFTTLATVGFGDYYPVSIEERAIFTMVFIGGVSMFSFIMGELMLMLKRIQNLEKDFTEEDQLERFFILITKFNNSYPMEKSLQQNIINHLNYRWTNNKNNFIVQPADHYTFT
jgi:hypothetical protein